MARVARVSDQVFRALVRKRVHGLKDRRLKHKHRVEQWPPALRVPQTFGVANRLVRGFVEEVTILRHGTEIARHARSYGQGVFVYDPLHSLTLVEMKPNALDQAAALQGWDLPEAPS